MTIVGPAIGQIVILSRPRFQQLLGAFRVIAHIPFAAVIPSRIAMSVRDWLPPSIDNRNKRQDAPLVGRVVDTVILKVSLADGVDGAQQSSKSAMHCLLLAANAISKRISSSRFFLAASRRLRLTASMSFFAHGRVWTSL